MKRTLTISILLLMSMGAWADEIKEAEVTHYVDEETLKKYEEYDKKRSELAKFDRENPELAAIRREEESRQEAFNKLYSTCLSYGFEERSDIASCIQQEIFNEKRLAILEQQKLAQNTYQNQEQVEKQEENNIWLNILEGVTDHLADPNTWEIARLNAELKRRPLKRYPAPPIQENPNK